MIRDLEYQERKNHVEKAEEYRKNLEIQQMLLQKRDSSQKSRSTTPKNTDMRFAHTKPSSIFYTPFPKLSYEQVVPEYKNQYRVPIDLGALPAFQQPKYTKHSPKIVPSYPVTGNGLNENFRIPEVKDSHNFYGIRT